MDVADVVIIGAGVAGTAIARTLARYSLDVVLTDAACDVGTGTSKANTAILHTGFDAKPGSLESRLLSRGSALLRSYAAEAGIPVERTGALLVAWTPEQTAALPAIMSNARRNGYLAVRPVRAEELYAREPRLGPGALGALEVPDESIICPWTTPLAFATEAVGAGVSLRLSTRVTGVAAAGDHYRLDTTRGPLRGRWVVNAAGLGSDTVDRMFGGDGFTIRPRRGELIVFDKLARTLLRSILLPVPTARTKGVLVAPTVYGNVLLGPTAEDVRDRCDTATTEAGLRSLRAAGRRILPGLAEEEVTSTYAGLRAATEHSDYQIYVDARRRYACVGGIRSTGLSASLGIAEHVAGLLGEAGLVLKPRPRFRGSAAGHAVHRGGGPAAVPGRGPDRGRPGVRPDRLPLRTGHPGRDQGRPGQPRAARRPGRPAPQDTRGERALPGLLLRGRGVAAAGVAAAGVAAAGIAAAGIAAEVAAAVSVDVLVVGAGPAGLSAAIELRRLGAGSVLVAERETSPGGVPRHSWHTGYGLRDLRRMMSGPAYAQALASAAKEAGAELRPGTTVTGWETADGDGQAGSYAVTLTSAGGIETVRAASVLLATGCRERPRAARLVPGDRPAGVMTTGELQQRVYLGHERLAGRALVIGAEHVSFSAAVTLAHAGARVVALVTEYERQQSYAAFRVGAALRWRVPVWTACAVRRVIGRGRLAGVEVADVRTGAARFVPCVTVVFTGDWIPDHELARLAGLAMDPGTRGPVVDTTLETSAAGVFAAGNLVHAAETADIAALSGRHAARHIAAFLGAGSLGLGRLGPGRLGLGRLGPGRLGRSLGRDRVRSGGRSWWSRRWPGSHQTRSRPAGPLPRWAGSCCAAASSAVGSGWKPGRMAGSWPGPARSGWCQDGPRTSAPTGSPESTPRVARSASSSAEGRSAAAGTLAH